MKKPDYKGAEKALLAFLETVPEPTTPSSNNIARYFIGFDDGGYKISEQQAEKFIEPWRDNWLQPKHQTKAED